MAVRKIRKGNVTLPVNDPSIPTIPYAGRYSLVVDQDGSLSWEAKAGSPSVTSLLNDTLVSLDVDDALSQVRANAVYGKEKLQSIDLPLINGPIGDYAFSGLLSLSHMSFDKWSDVTSLGVGCFTGIGVNRNSAERFVFDFRNSSFKRFTGFASTSREPSYDSQGEEVAPGVQGYGLWNTTIHLPPTVDELGDTDYSHSGVDRAVLDGSENVDLYVSSATPPQLYSTAQLPKDEASHIMVLYKYMSRYRYATNWSAIENMFGFAYAEEFERGAVLPLCDEDGYKLIWYSDKALTNVITEATGFEVYCVGTNDKIGAKIYTKCVNGKIEIMQDDEPFEDPVLMVGDDVVIECSTDVPGYVLKILYAAGHEIAPGDTIVSTGADIYIEATFAPESYPTFLPTFSHNTLDMIADVFDVDCAPDTWRLGDSVFIQGQTWFYVNNEACYELSDGSGYAKHILMAYLPNSNSFNSGSKSYEYNGASFQNGVAGGYFNSDIYRNNKTALESYGILDKAATLRIPYAINYGEGYVSGNRPSVQYYDEKFALPHVYELYQAEQEIDAASNYVKQFSLFRESQWRLNDHQGPTGLGRSIWYVLFGSGTWLRSLSRYDSWSATSSEMSYYRDTSYVTSPRPSTVLLAPSKAHSVRQADGSDGE